MRIIGYEKQYSDGHKVYYDLQASNAPFVYIDGQSANPPQQPLETDDFELYIDETHRKVFNTSEVGWNQKIITYMEENHTSSIYWGTIFRWIEFRDGIMKYECERAGRKINHDGMILQIDWQNVLFEEWKKEFQTNN